MNRKVKVILLSGFIFVIAISLCVFKSLKPSYAIPVDSYSGVPNGDFTTNAQSGNITYKNLVGDALGSGYSQSFKNNFAAANGYKDSDNTYALYTLSKNKLIPTNKETFEVSNETVNPINVNDYRLAYLLKIGYSNLNNKKTVFNNPTYKQQYGTITDDSVKEYITQIAVWLYIAKYSNDYSSTYCANDGCIFYENTSTDPNNPNIRTISYNELMSAIDVAVANDVRLNYIKAIISEADLLAGITLNNTLPFTLDTSLLNSYTFVNNKEALTTGLVGFSNTLQDFFISYDVTVIDPNHYGIYLVDENNQRITNTTDLDGNFKFKLYVPLRSNLSSMDLTSAGVKVTVHAMYSVNSVNTFTVTKTVDQSIVVGSGGTKTERFSNVLLGLSSTDTYDTPLYLSNFTDITKVDATNGNEVAGAHLVLYGAADIDSTTHLPVNNATILEEWNSEIGLSHKMFLDDGDYALCETIAPDGYIRQETCVTFSVDNGTAITVYAMENQPIPIPNTASFKSKVSYTIGACLVIIGILGMTIILGNNKRKNED